MATKSYIHEKQIQEALEILKSQGPLALSQQLGEWLEARLSAHPLWQKARPYKLGSWSRAELSAKSDIDLLFVGPEDVVLQLVNDFLREGLRLRYRVPADLNDWTVNVEAFDVLALLSAQPFFKEDLVALEAQQKIILARGVKYKKQLFRTMMQERRERAVRYDSIATYLEPNLKYGPGGLRDLEQGLMIHSLFSERFDHDEVLQQLHGLKIELMKIRHYLHLSGASDVLVSGLQGDAAVFLGFANSHELMSKLSGQLADVSFYADLIAEVAQKPQPLTSKRVGAQSVSVVSSKTESTLNFEQALRALDKKPTLQTQYLLRRQKIDMGSRKKIGPILQKFFTTKMTDTFLQSLFRSQLLDRVVVNLARLRGHVQHDQYHRYSVDAHTLQAVREVLRIFAKPKRLGRLAKFVEQLSAQDWQILLWSALYHDLGKGLKGDHSSVGAGIVKRDFIEMGLSLELTRQVSWMVQSHLLLSGAAFRQNPHSAKTWSELFARGVKGPKLLRLAIFTAIDIRATNPEAWNEWKERLLFEITEAMSSAPASRLGELLETAEKNKIRIDRNFIENLDPQVIESVPRTKLLQDYQSCLKARASLPALVLRGRSGEYWVRFHALHDRPGLFLNFTSQLHSAGLGVQEAFVQTYADIGAYDWFKVKTSKPIQVLRGMLKSSTSAATELKAVDSLAGTKLVSAEILAQVKFDKIEVVSQDDESVILSFRGKDQRGALLVAAHALFELGFEIQSAKVHTWGRQIDDVFTVKQVADLESRLQFLRDKLVNPSL